MQTIAMFNTRGGSGKSAATVFLADFLSTAFKKRVLVIDLDPQQSSSIALLGEERLYEAFGQEKCLPVLMQWSLDGEITCEDTLAKLIERPKYRGRKGVAYLESVSVMACQRESWYDLDASLMNGAARRADYDTLRRLLSPLDGRFDICLIDFPGHEVGPIAKNGLKAADWWLFPCVPDRAGIRDIEGPVTAIRDAYKGSKRQIQGLGTLLSISQPATSSEYRQAFQTLKSAAEKGIIPPLFSNDARMLIWTGARNALDDTLWDESSTLAQKYKEKPLHEASRNLCKEVLQRLAMPAEEVKLNFGLLNGLNRLLRTVFVGSKAR